jgi:predicted O-methyltransferase YrrM
MPSPYPPSPLVASPETVKLLDELHSRSLAEESSLKNKLSLILAIGTKYLFQRKFIWHKKLDAFFSDKLVALERDKAEFVYLLLRSLGATKVVEAGTSHGVSTLWLALAVRQNVLDRRDGSSDGVVIATENNTVKANKARENWAKAGEDVGKYIDLREGDLRETLKTGLPDGIGLLLLDSKLKHFFVILRGLVDLWKI